MKLVDTGKKQSGFCVYEFEPELSGDYGYISLSLTKNVFVREFTVLQVDKNNLFKALP